MEITANQSMEKKEPWWKAITSFWSISKKDAEESEINEIEKQHDSKYINELEEKHSGKEEDTEINNRKNGRIGLKPRKEIDTQGPVLNASAGLRSKEKSVKDKDENIIE